MRTGALAVPLRDPSRRRPCSSSVLMVSQRVNRSGTSSPGPSHPATRTPTLRPVPATRPPKHRRALRDETFAPTTRPASPNLVPLGVSATPSRNGVVAASALKYPADVDHGPYTKLVAPVRERFLFGNGTIGVRPRIRNWPTTGVDSHPGVIGFLQVGPPMRGGTNRDLP